MQRKTFDIWIESFTPPFSTGFLPLFSNKPVVGLAHLLGGKDMAKKYNMPFHIIESFGLKFYSYLIAITDDLKTQIHRINPNAEVVVIPNGLVVTDEILAKDIPKKHILFIGRFDCYQKGIDLLLQAYSLSETQNSYPLVIAGQGNKRETQHLKSLIKQYGIENRVHLVGKVEGKTKENLFKESILTVAPSRFESFGLTLVEAFYYKSPVITFDIDGLKWIDATYCKKVPPFDIPALVKAMNELISNPTQRATYIKTSTEFVKQFNWDDATKKYETFLQYVHLAQSPAPKITPAIQPTK